MQEWLTYELSDLLLFSERVYWRLFELENAALWPLPLFAPLTAVAALFAYTRRPAAGPRLLHGLLALAWLSVGLNFVLERYAPINWGMGYVVPLFILQAVVFISLALRPQVNGSLSRIELGLGYGLILAALAYPLLAFLQERGIAGAEVFGIAPDPTALASLGALFLVTGCWQRLAAVVVPCLWLGQSAVTLFVLDGAAALAPALGIAVGVVGLVASGRRPVARRG